MRLDVSASYIPGPGVYVAPNAGYCHQREVEEPKVAFPPRTKRLDDRNREAAWPTASLLVGL